MKTLTPIVVSLVLGALSACSSMSGYDAKSSFACKAPDGILCESMSGIYANARANNLPGQRGSGRAAEPAEPQTAKTGAAVMSRPIESGTPIRSAPRVLRVWFAPWEDSDGDLHDQSYVYLPVDSGRWLIEQGELKAGEASWPAIRDWARRNPQRVQQMLQANPRVRSIRWFGHSRRPKQQSGGGGRKS